MTQTKTRADPRTWDFLLTTIFVILMIVLAVVGVVVGLGMSFSTTLCAEDAACASPLTQWGTTISAFAPPVLAVLFTIICIVRVGQRRISFGFALLGLAMMIAALLLGVIVFQAGMDGQRFF